VIALDTNILVYARREESPFHGPARDLLLGLAAGAEPWALPWPCVYEFLRVVTHPRVFDPPTRLADALEDLESLIACPSLRLLGEGPGHLRHLGASLRGGGVAGNLVHDGYIAALLAEHGVRELLTVDRDFARFPGLRSRNPFAPPG
jgi:toxin-antitoxin system PIN domain toxin